MRQRNAVAVVCMAALLLAGCSGGDKKVDGPAEGRRYVDPNLNDRPCALMKAPELSEAIGGKFLAGRPHTGSAPIGVVGMQYCRFSLDVPADPTKRAPGQLPSTVYVGLTSAFAEESFNKFKGARAAQITPVASLGDEAVYAHAGTSDSVVVLQEGKVVGVQLVFVQKDARAIAEQLAHKALSRL